MEQLASGHGEIVRHRKCLNPVLRSVAITSSWAGQERLGREKRCDLHGVGAHVRWDGTFLAV